MIRFMVVALIFALSDIAGLKRGKKRWEMFVYIMTMSAALCAGFFYFTGENAVSFVEAVLSILGLRG